MECLICVHLRNLRTGISYTFAMISKASTVQEYISSLPEDRRIAISRVRDVILANLDKDYEEGMSYGMIGYYVPHRVFPAGYHCDPKQGLPFAGLASQKNFMAVYLMGLYTSAGANESALVRWFREAWAKSGKKKLEMGKACIRFKKVDDLALDVLGEAIRRMPAKTYIDHYMSARRDIENAGGARKAAAKRRQSA
jgi:hypothetical protein